MMHRAYSTLELKATDEVSGILEGIASTPTPDRVGDIMEPKGAQFQLPMPLLWMHNHKQPIGMVTHADVTTKGIKVKAQIKHGIGVPYIDEAWNLIKHGLVKGLSIGFKGIEAAPIKNAGSPMDAIMGGLHFLKWSWLELSAVTIPANAEANIATIKSLDVEAMRDPQAFALNNPHHEYLSTTDRVRVMAEVAARRAKGLPVVKL